MNKIFAYSSLLFTIFVKFQVMATNLLLINGAALNYQTMNLENATKFLTGPQLLDPQDVHGDHLCQSPNDVAAFGGYYYLTCSLSQEIQIYTWDQNTQKLQINKIIKFPDNTNPWNIAIKDINKAYTASFLGDKIVIFNPSVNLNGNPRMLGEIDLKKITYESFGEATLPKPQQILLKDNILYVSITNLNQQFVAGGPGYVVLIDTTTDKIIKAVKSNTPNTVSIMRDPRQGFTHLLYFINAGTFDLNRRSYLGNGSVDIYDSAKKMIVKNIKIGGAPTEMVFDAKKNIAYLTDSMNGQLLRFDLDTNQVLPSYSFREATNPGGCNYSNSFSFLSAIIKKERTLFVTDYAANCLYEFDLDNESLKNNYSSSMGPDVLFLL